MWSFLVFNNAYIYIKYVFLIIIFAKIYTLCKFYVSYIIFIYLPINMFFSIQNNRLEYYTKYKIRILKKYLGSDAQRSIANTLIGVVLAREHCELPKNN